MTPTVLITTIDGPLIFAIGGVIGLVVGLLAGMLVGRSR